MENFKVIIFNVERGFCAFVRSPNNYGLLIDCGNSVNFSPIKYILDNEIKKVQEFEGYTLAHFVCSHPHDDHITDIERLKNELAPRIITGLRFDKWDEIKDPTEKSKDSYANLDSYSKFRDTYTEPVKTYPDWGMMVNTNLGLTISESKKINSDRSAWINNTSRIVILNYKGFKFVFPGDLMKDGWEILLKRESFKKALEGTRFFIASHHGHTSGYTNEIFKSCKPWLSIVSEKPGEDVDPAYSSEENISGVTINDKLRRMITTRKDGSIIIEVDNEGKWYFNTF